MKKKKDSLEGVLKFAVLGLSALAITSGIAFKDDLVNSYEKHKNIAEMTHVLKSHISSGLGTSLDKQVEIRVGFETANVGTVWYSFASYDKVDEGVCQVMLTLGGNVNNVTDMKKINYGTEDQLKKVNQIVSDEDKMKAVEMVGIHEAVHCDEIVADKRFNISGNDKLSNALNSIYLNESISVPASMMLVGEDFSDKGKNGYKRNLLMNGSLNSLLSEGYAEAGSSIYMVRKYGEGAKGVLAHRQAVSGVDRVTLMGLNGHVLYKHSTDGINYKYGTNEGIELAKSLKGVEDIKKVAWEDANLNVLQALKSRGDLSELLNDKFWKKEALIMYRMKVIGENMNLPNNFSPIMNERFKEIEESVPQDLLKEFKTAVMKEARKEVGEQANLELYNKVFQAIPELKAGAEEIRVIQQELPKEVAKVQSSQIYDVKSIDGIIEFAQGTYQSNDIQMKVNVPKKDTVKDSEALKLKI